MLVTLLQTLARVFVIPYVIDMAGAIPGPRSHASGVKAGTNTVEQAWNPGYGVTIGSVEKVGPQKVRDYGTGGPKQFGIELLWSATDRAGAFLSAPIVRGSPYTTVWFTEWEEFSSACVVDGCLAADDAHVHLIYLALSYSPT